MTSKTLAALLSFILAFGPAAPALAAGEASEALPVRIQAARDQLKGHFTGATLARADYAPLQAEIQTAAADSAAQQAWGAFEPPAHRYNALRGGLLSLPNDKLADEVHGLAQDLALAPTEEDGLLERYAQLKATLLENGVVARDGKYYGSNGKPLGDGDLAALLAKTLPPRLTDEQRLAAAGDLKALAEVKKAIGDKDYNGAVAKLNQVLDGMGQRADLQTGFGSLPMQTALAMIQQTRAALPGQYRSQVDTKNLDRQLLSVANKKIEVPDAPADEKAGNKQALAPFRTGVQLSFYASLTGFPLVSHWAAKKVYETSGTDALARNPQVAAFRYAETDPAGAAKPGFYMTFKDGSKRYEARDGSSALVSKDGLSRVEQNPAAGSYRQTAKAGPDAPETEVMAWARGKDGVVRGRFHGRAFEAAADEQIVVSPDGQRLFIAKGFGKDGKPAVRRWLGADGERGRMLADGLGTSVLHMEDGRLRRDIFLEPAAVKKATGEVLDLSSAAPDLDVERGRKLAQFMNDLPKFGLLFANAMNGVTNTDRGATRSNWIESASIRDGRLTLVLGEKLDLPQHKGTPSYPDRVTAEVETDGRVKVFLFSPHTTFMWTFDAGQNHCDQFNPDVEKGQAGQTAFVLSRKYERRGEQWVMTENHPIQLKEWTSADTLKAIGSGTLQTVGAAGEVVFSPFQSAHHYLHSGLVEGMSALADVHNFGAFDGVYSRRQSTFNKWAGAGLDSPAEIQAAYADGMKAAGGPDKQKEIKNFLDGVVDDQRRARYGELYRFHQDDPVTDQDRAYAAATKFGLSNLAGNYFEAGKDSFAQGNKWSGVGNYAIGAFAVGGQMYVQGFGFGAAAQGLKVMAAGARTGLTMEQVAAAAQRAALLEKGVAGVAGLSKAEATAVGMMKTMSRAETALFVAPGGAQLGISGYQGIQSWRSGDTRAALGHLDNFISGAAAFLIPMGIGRGGQLANEGIRAVFKGEGPVGTDGKPLPKPELKPDLKPEVNPDAKPAGSAQDEFLASLKGDQGAALAAQHAFETDAMTQLPNRAAIDKTADGILAKAEKPTVAIMDMNNFGAVNDGLAKSYGPSKGKYAADHILFKAATRLKALALEHNVTLGRYGGEEFAVLGERSDVMGFVEAAKLEFKDGQALRDTGFGEGTADYAAIKEAATKKGRGDQSIGDFTFGVAGAEGRKFSDALHSADAALGQAKDKGGRGGAFVEIPGENGAPPSYAAAEAGLDQAGMERAALAKQTHDQNIHQAQAPNVAEQMARMRKALGPEKFAQFMKVAFVDPLTQTRTSEYVSAQSAEWGPKYADGGEGALISARGLKLINDALGHDKGDAYLRALGQALREVVGEQQRTGSAIEDPVRVGSKDFFIVGKDPKAAVRLVEAKMAEILKGDTVLNAADRAKMAERAKGTGEDPAQAGTLRSVSRPLERNAKGADVFKTMDELTHDADAAKRLEQPAPPPPPLIPKKPGAPTGTLKVVTQGDPSLSIAFDRKPGNLEATFPVTDGEGRALMLKTPRYRGTSAASDAHMRAAVAKEAGLMRRAAEIAQEPGFPKNVAVAKFVNYVEMPAELVKQVYGDGEAMPAMLIERVEAKTLQAHLDGGGKLSLKDFEGLVDAYHKLHEGGFLHGDPNMGNILISGEPGAQKFTIIDFNASKERASVSSSRWIDYKGDEISGVEDILTHFAAQGQLVEDAPVK